MKLIIIEDQAEMEDYILRNILADDNSYPPGPEVIPDPPPENLQPQEYRQEYPWSAEHLQFPQEVHPLPLVEAVSVPTLPPNSLFRKFDPYELSQSPGSGSSSRQSRNRTCKFCKRNGETARVYRSHNLMEGGKVSCPHLRSKVCRLCGATGDNAHTVTYCPFNTNHVPITTMLRNTARTSDGRVRRNFGFDV